MDASNPDGQDVRAAIDQTQSGPVAPNIPAANQSPSLPEKEKKYQPRTHKKLVGRISRESAEYLMDNLSMLISSGVSVGAALESIAAEVPDKRPRRALLDMRKQIDDGVPFFKAMDSTGLFSPSTITLVEIGESTGQLADNLKVIAVQMHKNNVMASRVKAAMLYPAFLLTLLFLVGTGIGVFLLPRLLTIIKSLQVQVGPITSALIVVGTFFGHFGLLTAALIILIIIGLAIAIRLKPPVKWAFERVLFHIPGIKKLLFETEMARFGFILGTLLEAGLPVTTSLESLANSMTTHRYQLFTNDLRQKIEEGNSFSKVLLDPKVHKMIPGTICQIIISAETSGNLAPSLLSIGQNYEDKADITARNLETLLEPIVLVILAAGVLFVALAVFLPIYSLIGNFNATGK